MLDLSLIKSCQAHASKTLTGKQKIYCMIFLEFDCCVVSLMSLVCPIKLVCFIILYFFYFGEI